MPPKRITSTGCRLRAAGICRKQIPVYSSSDRANMSADKEIALEMNRETMMKPIAFPLPTDFRTVSNQRFNRGNKENDEQQNQGKGEERMILEAMWNHQGPISTLDLFHIPRQSTSNGIGENEADEEEDEDMGLTMKSTSRRSRPSPLSFHRQTSSLGANFFSSIISPLQSPGTPTIQEEVFANPED